MGGDWASGKPVIFVIGGEAATKGRVGQELRRRYAADYDVICSGVQEEGLRTLATLRDEGRDVALILAPCGVEGMDGEAFLQRAHTLFPEARRALLLANSDPATAQTVLHATAMGTIEAYGSEPAVTGDEEFHYLITGLLREWAAEHRPRRVLVRVVGERVSRRCHELRDLLHRNNVAYRFYDGDSEEGRALLLETAQTGGPFPVVVLAGGRALANPSNADLAGALDMISMADISGVPTDRVVDVVIVGAGPAGLSAAVYGASEGLYTVVVEREAIGGQAGMSSRIRNYPGFPMGVSGSDLAVRAYWQAWLFGTDFAFAQEVAGLEVDGDERHILLGDGARVRTRTVLLAMGADYRRLNIPSLEALTGAGIYYGSVGAEALYMKGERVYVAGGGNSAGQAIVYLARFAERATLLVRGDSLAKSMSEYLIKEIEGTENIDVRLRTQVVGGSGGTRLEQLVLENCDTGERETVAARALFVVIGAAPHTGWLPDSVQRAQSGYIVTGADLLNDTIGARMWPLSRPPYLLETSMPGVFAAGDVRHGSLKRLASAVGEGSVAITFIHQYLMHLR